MMFLGFWRQIVFKLIKPDTSIFTVLKAKKDILKTKISS